MATPEPKTCASCGRRIEWRKKWERDWDSVRYCSSSCRRRGVDDVDRRLEATILTLLDRRGRSRTLSTSDVARAVGTAEAWEDLREPARRAARRLADAGDVVITQGGHVVDPSTARGEMFIRRA